MSDLPNFNRSWFRRLGGMKILIGALVVVLSALAWAFSNESPLGLLLKFDPNIRHVMIGAPYSVKATLKNEAAQTMKVDLQAVLYAKDASCMEQGKHLNFSHPLNVKVAPNDTVAVELTFDPLLIHCEMSVGMKAFLTAEMDGKRFPLTQDADLSISIL